MIYVKCMGWIGQSTFSNFAGISIFYKQSNRVFMSLKLIDHHQFTNLGQPIGIHYSLSIKYCLIEKQNTKTYCLQRNVF